MKDLTKIHNCEQSQGKMVLIELDRLIGKSFCGYCHQEVDYLRFFQEEFMDDAGIVHGDNLERFYKMTGLGPDDCI